MKFKWNKEDTNYEIILGVDCLFEYDWRAKMWEGWIKSDSSQTFLAKDPKEVYSDLYSHIKGLQDESNGSCKT